MEDINNVYRTSGEDSGSRFLFVDAEFYPLIENLDIKEVRVVIIDDMGTPDDPYEEFLDAGSPKPLQKQLADEEEPISINYTSGTTGRPKGVVYSHRGAYLNSLGSIIEMCLNLNSLFLWIIPMFHCNGWCFTWAATGVGGTRKKNPLIRFSGM